MKKEQKKPLFPSLRSRYAATASILVLIALVSAIWGYFSVTQIRVDSISNIEQRTVLVNKSLHIRNAVWESQHALQNFLLSPHDEKIEAHFRQSLDIAIASAEALLLEPWVKHNDLTQNVLVLKRALLELKTKSEFLIDTRKDAAKQYPTIALATSTMEPQVSKFVTATDLAISELENSHGQMHILHLFFETRHNWMHMINSFRMYLANRIGSFSVDALPNQVKDVELFYDATEIALTELEKESKKNKLDFQGEDSIINMREALKEWRLNFEKTVELHNSNQWRTDIGILTTDIQPNFQQAWTALMTLDIKSVGEANNNLVQLSDITKFQSRAIIASGLVAIILIVLGYLVLDKAILKPIKNLTDALRLETSGETELSLPEGQLNETRDLVHAFKEMRHQVHTRQAELEHQAMHDTLTGLPNRTLLLDRITQTIITAKRSNANPALLIMDLDFFKEVNDTLGHRIGDNLLYQVGNLIKYNLRAMDTVARLGGDEFAVLINDTNEKKALLVAKKIITLITRPFIVKGHTINIGASIGVALFPQHGDNSEDLIKHADAAMYTAKKNKLDYSLYNAKEDITSIERLRLIADLKHAIKNDQLELYYQPKLDLQSNTISGIEALLRWQHPALGFIPPQNMIAMAEQAGVVNKLSRWVIRSALSANKHLLTQEQPIQMAINLAAHNLQDKSLASFISEQLAENGISPETLTLEICENGLMEDPEEIMQQLEPFLSMGITLSVDDFGTGFSSLPYLKKLRIKELKIDTAFVKDICRDANDAAVVLSAIQLAHNLGLSAVAEGVEKESVLQKLKEMSCDSAQGFYLCKPLPLAELNQWLQTRTSGAS